MIDFARIWGYNEHENETERSSWIRRTDHGPVIFCDEGLSEELEERGVHNLWISLSHEGEYAVAFVVLES